MIGFDLAALLAVEAAHHGVDVLDLTGRTRRWPVVAARVACYRALRAQGWSFRQIGRAFGRTHSSIKEIIAVHDGWDEMRGAA